MAVVRFCKTSICGGACSEFRWVCYSVAARSMINLLKSQHRGGCRGVMELIILLELEYYIREAGLRNVRVSDMFDLIIGTSTGLRSRYSKMPTSSRTNIL
jgi:hypothetical protein